MRRSQRAPTTTAQLSVVHSQDICQGLWLHCKDYHETSSQSIYTQNISHHVPRHYTNTIFHGQGPLFPSLAKQWMHKKSARSCQSYSKNPCSRIPAPGAEPAVQALERWEQYGSGRAAVTQGFVSSFYFGRLFCFQKGFHYVSSPASNALFSGSLDLQGLVGIIDTPVTFRSEVPAKFYSGELESRRSMKAKCWIPFHLLSITSDKDRHAWWLSTNRAAATSTSTLPAWCIKIFRYKCLNTHICSRLPTVL